MAEINNTVAYFIPEHETADEIKDKLISVGVSPDEVDIIQGYSRSCKRIKHLNDEEKVGLFQNWQVCLSCPHFHEGCVYHNQFRSNTRIRIYPQAYLYHPSSSDRFKPHFVIVDESIAENIRDITEYKRNQSKIFKKMIDGEVVRVEDVDAELNRLRKLFGKHDNNDPNQLIPPPAYHFDSDLWQEQLNRNKAKTSGYRKIKHLEELKKHLSGAYTEYMIWRRGGRLYFGRKKKIDSRWHSKPILHLDASGNRKITEIVFEKEFEVYEKIRCQYAKGVRVIQIFDKLFSKNQCSEDKTWSDLKWLCSMLGDKGKIGFIGYKQIDNKPFITKLVSNEDSLLWYGGLRGKNKIEDSGCDTLVTIGRNMLSEVDLVNMACVLFGTNDFILDKATVKKTYRMKDGNHISASFVEYVDERLQALSEVVDKAETYQAGHRLRLLHTPNRTLLLLTNEVLDFTINELFTVEQIIPQSDKRRKLIEAIKENDGLIPMNKNKIIMEKTGLSESQVKSMKSKDKEWIRYNFWFYVDEVGMFRFSPFFGGDIGGDGAEHIPERHIPES